MNFRVSAVLVLLVWLIGATFPALVRAQCARCQMGGVPCPPGEVACTTADTLQFGTTECSQVPGCGAERSSDGGATCGLGAFADCAPLGACCRPDGSCSEASQNLCEVDGFFAGEGTTCNGFVCPVVGGACCSRFSGSCERATEPFCVAFGSFGGNFYLGDGSECSDGACGCCQCDCPAGGSCIQAMEIGGCVTACQDAGCSFPAGATGDVCVGPEVCARNTPVPSPVVAPTASNSGLAVIVALLVVAGSFSIVRRHRT